jgi:hypothetical protein
LDGAEGEDVVHLHFSLFSSVPCFSLLLSFFSCGFRGMYVRVGS